MWRRTAWPAAGNIAAALPTPVMPTAPAPAGGRVDQAGPSRGAGALQAAGPGPTLGDALGGRRLRFPGAGQALTQERAVVWSRPEAAVPAVERAWNAASATNGAGRLEPWPGNPPVPASLQLNGPVCTGSPVGRAPSRPVPSVPAPAIDPAIPASSVASNPSGARIMPPPPATPAPSLRVGGDQGVTAAGTPCRCYGTDLSGGTSAGHKSWDGAWSGPTDPATVPAMRIREIHGVRVPLAGECRLAATGYSAPEYRETAFQNAVKLSAALLVTNGTVPIGELRRSYSAGTINSFGCAEVVSLRPPPMPDAASRAGLAPVVKRNGAVMFDLFTEPYPERAGPDAAAGRKCRPGGPAGAGINYPLAGFRTRVNVVRDTDAGDVIFLGGLAYSNDLMQWRARRPAAVSN
jgi:endoglucanase